MLRRRVFQAGLWVTMVGVILGIGPISARATGPSTGVGGQRYQAVAIDHSQHVMQELRTGAPSEATRGELMLHGAHAAGFLPFAEGGDFYIEITKAPSVIVPEPEPVKTFAQVYVDNASKTYYPDTCEHPASAAIRMSKSAATLQGYTLAAGCTQ